MSNVQTRNFRKHIYPIVVDDSAQSVRDGENSTVCKFSVGNGNVSNDHEDATDLQYELSYRLSNELIGCIVNAGCIGASLQSLLS